MERRVGAGAWFAAAGGLALMAPLAFVGVGVVAGVQAAGVRRVAGIADALGAASHGVRLGGARPARRRRARRRRGVRALDGVPRRAARAPPRSRRRSASPTRRCSSGRSRCSPTHGASPTGRVRHPVSAIAERDTAVLLRLDGFDSRLERRPRGVRHAPRGDRVAAAPALGRVRDHRRRARAARRRRVPRRQRAAGCVVPDAGSRWRSSPSSARSCSSRGWSSAAFARSEPIATAPHGGTRSRPQRTMRERRSWCDRGCTAMTRPFGTGARDVVRGEGHLGLPRGRGRRHTVYLSLVLPEVLRRHPGRARSTTCRSCCGPSAARSWRRSSGASSSRSSRRARAPRATCATRRSTGSASASAARSS